MCYKDLSGEKTPNQSFNTPTKSEERVVNMLHTGRSRALYLDTELRQGFNRLPGSDCCYLIVETCGMSYITAS